MQPNLIKILNEKHHPRELDELATRCADLVKMSRGVMKDYYPTWEHNDAIYRGERAPDAQDKKAEKRGEPKKVIVPLSYSQVQTFVALNTMLFTQRDYLYELGGTGIEDERPAKLAQACLQRDLEYNRFTGVTLPQWLTNVGRYGVGILKSDWLHDTGLKQVQVPDPKWQPNPALPNQTQPPTITQWQPFTKYLGNRIRNISPYRWFPDTRLPITDFRDGEFCADERVQSIAEMRKLARDGVVAGIDDIPPCSDKNMEDRHPFTVDPTAPDTAMTSASFDSRYFVLTEIQIRLNPSQALIAPNTPLNPEVDEELLYLIWIANDGRIIRIDEMGYDHEEFGYDAAQFFNDQERTLNFGLAELIGPSQDVVDWLMNARVANVRRVIQNQVVVHPAYVNMDDLADRSPVLRLKATVPVGLSVDSFIKQLQLSDVTTGHINDMNLVTGFTREATGISENILGQFSSGRRSAREASNVSANAMARQIVVSVGLWQNGLHPLGQKMLSNLRQGLDEEQLVQIVGLQRYMEQPDAVQGFISVNKAMLQGRYDFRVFDATLPSQRAAVATTLATLFTELAKIGSQNPKALLALGYDPKLVLDEILSLQNVRNAERFRLTPQRIAELLGMAQAVNNTMGVGPAQGAVQQQPNGGQPAG